MIVYLCAGYVVFGAPVRCEAVAAMKRAARYIVSSVTGVKINPTITGQASSHPPGTDYYVLDRAYCHREVARFAAETYRNQSAERRKRMAYARAAELNAWDEAEHGA